jgi:poly(3-hydroxybutyrate) depolymerase
MPEPADAAGWTNDDLEYLARLLQTALGRFNVDPRRIVIAGEGKAGQLAYALSFQGRRLIRGVAVVDSPLPRTLELPENTANERLAVLSVETQNTPLSLLIRQDLQKIQKAGYPAAQIVRRGEASRESALDATTRGTIARWIDGLDRL